MGSSRDISDEGGGVRKPAEEAEMPNGPENQDITLGSKWRHRREKYEVTVRAALLFKEGNDARWVDSVGYSIDGRNGEMRARSEVDFLTKFEEVK